MELLYAHEHLSCFNYERGDRPTIERKSLVKEQHWDAFPIENKAIFVTKGKLSFSFGDVLDREIPAGKILLLPAGSHYKSKAVEDSELLVMRLHNTKRLCDCFSLEQLLQEEKGGELSISDIFFLDINERVDSFLKFLDTCMTDGLKCTYYFELKSKEFYFLLRAYYRKEDLLRFFYPLLSKDVSFSDIVIKNHYKIRTVQEFAELTHYSLSGFQKKFKKVFGSSAHHWMREERSKAIYHQINSTEKSFKEISDEFGFSSPSHFNDFCKTNFGVTPGKVRKKRK